MSTWIDGHGFQRNATDIFVSCSHSDHSCVEVIVKQLQEEGFSVFWDQNSIPAGMDYGSFLHSALRNSKLVLVVWSTKSTGSDWVYSEAEYARSRKRLVACKIDNCLPIPPFNTFQTVDLSDWRGDLANGNWQAIVDLIRFRVTTGNALAPMGSIEDPPSG